MPAIVDGKHKYLGRPDKEDWGPLHKARVKVTDIDAIVKSRKGRLLCIEFKGTYGDRVYIDYLQWLVIKELYEKGIETWVVATSEDDDSFYNVLQDVTPHDRPLVEKKKDREGRTRSYWVIDKAWDLWDEDQLIAELEQWYDRDPD